MRTKFHWKVQLQEDTGKIVERTVAAFWSPEKEGTKEAIGDAAKVAAHMASNKRHEYAPVAVTLLDAAA